MQKFGILYDAPRYTDNRQSWAEMEARLRRSVERAGFAPDSFEFTQYTNGIPTRFVDSFSRGFALACAHVDCDVLLLTAERG